MVQVAGKIAGLEKSAAVDDPPARKEGREGFRHAPPERKKNGAEAEHREQ